LNQDEMASALGMAGTQSAGLWAFTADGAMSKRFHAGRSSQSGIMGALLAQKGFKGPTQILEAEDGGFCRATSDQVDLSLILDGLGEKFLSGEVNMKPYACCASVHSAIDGVRQLVQRHGMTVSEIDRVLVKTAKGVKVQCGFEYQPLSVLQAQMSLQYCLAVTLLEGRVLIEHFEEEKISDSRVMDLARRVEIVLDPEIEKVYPEKFANNVEFVMKDGRKFETRVDHPIGSPENPMTFEQVSEKFEGLAERAIKKDRIDALIGMIENLEGIENIRALTRLLA